MRCEDARQLMMARLDGESGADDGLTLHLATCGACGADWQSLQRVDDALRSHSMVDAPAGFAGRVLAVVGREFAPQWLRYLRRGIWVVTGAVVAVSGLVSLHAGWEGAVDHARWTPIAAGICQGLVVLAQLTLPPFAGRAGMWALYCIMGVSIAVAWFGALIVPRLALRTMPVSE